MDSQSVRHDGGGRARPSRRTERHQRRLAVLCAAALLGAPAIPAVLAAAPAALATPPAGCTGVPTFPATQPFSGNAALTFANASDGWVVGTELAGSGSCSSAVPSIAATVDGGATWAPEALPVGTPGLGAIAATSPADAWAAGSVGAPAAALSTTDGGASWTLHRLSLAGGTRVTGIATAGPTLAWVASETAGGSVGISSTTDAGQTWQADELPGLGTSTLNGLAVEGPANGWAVGGTTPPGSTGPAIGLVLATTDGGQRWTEEPLPTGTGPLTAVSFVSRSIGWAAGTATGAARPVLLSTTDGGRTWTTEPLAAATPAATQLDAVHFANPDDGWLAGGVPNGSGTESPLVEATTDGGRSWRLVTEGLPGVGALDGVAASSGTVAWATGVDTGVLATTDGTSWHDQPGAATVSSLDGVAALGTNHAAAVGQRCTVLGCSAVALSSSDGGASWTASTLPSGETLLSAVTGAVPGTSTGAAAWAVGQGTNGTGAVLGSADGGSSWTSEGLPSGVGPLFAVSFPSATDGWAGGETAATGSSGAGGAGMLVHTTDGGTAWQVAPVEVRTSTGPEPAPVDPVSGVSFVGTSDGWIVTEGQVSGGSTCPTDAAILATTNGGKTWEFQTVPSGVASLAGVAFASPSVGWAVGSTCAGTGVVLATTDGGTSWAAQTLPSGTGILDGVAAASTTTAWAVGRTIASGPGGAGAVGLTISTTDGGSSWLVGARTASATEAVAATSTGTLLLTGQLGHAQASLDLLAPTTGAVHPVALPGADSAASSGTDPSVATAAVSARGVGPGTLALQANRGDPVESAPTGATGTFVTLSSSPASDLSSVTVEDCAMGGAESVSAWSGSAWLAATSQRFDPETGCDTIDVAPTSTPGLASLETGIALVPTGTVPLGYDVARANGGIDNEGIPWTGSAANRLPAGVHGVSLASDPETAGYWLLTSNGGIENFAAPWSGSPKADGGVGNNPVVAIASAPGGELVLRLNGGVDNFGAAWHGSLADRLPTGVHAVGIATDWATGGYWVLTSDGGVFNFAAPWYGSPKADGGVGSNPAVAIAADGEGYLVARADGGVDNQGTAWFGSLAGRLPAGVSLVGVAADGPSGGYWLLTSNGGVYNFAAPWYGSPKADGGIGANAVVGIAAP